MGLYRHFETRSHSTVQAGLELTVALLPQPRRAKLFLILKKKKCIVLLSVYMFIYVGVCLRVTVVKGQHSGVGSLLPFCGVPGIKLSSSGLINDLLSH